MAEYGRSGDRPYHQCSLIPPAPRQTAVQRPPAGGFAAVVSCQLSVKQLGYSGLALKHYPCKSVFIRGLSY